MPRLRLITALLAIAFFAAWSATSQLEMYLGNEIRKLLWLLVLAPSIAAVVYYRGRQQAFWVGFVLVLLLRALPNEWVYTPEFQSTINRVIRYSGAGQDVRIAQFLDGTVQLVFTIAIGVACGCMFSAVYQHASKHDQ